MEIRWSAWLSSQGVKLHLSLQGQRKTALKITKMINSEAATSPGETHRSPPGSEGK